MDHQPRSTTSYKTPKSYTHGGGGNGDRHGRSHVLTNRSDTFTQIDSPPIVLQPSSALTSHLSDIAQTPITAGTGYQRRPGSGTYQGCSLGQNQSPDPQGADGNSSNSRDSNTAHLTQLFKEITGHYPAVEDITSALEILNSRKGPPNPGCWLKLKRYMILSGRDEEARNFDEKYIKLTESGCLKQLDALGEFMMNSFDRNRYTSAIISTKAQSNRPANNPAESQRSSRATLPPKPTQSILEEEFNKSGSILASNDKRDFELSSFVTVRRRDEDNNTILTPAVPNYEFRSGNSTFPSVPTTPTTTSSRPKVDYSTKPQQYQSPAVNGRHSHSNIPPSNSYQEIASASRSSSRQGVPFDLSSFGTRTTRKHDQDQKATERALVQDLVYIFQGIDGKLIKRRTKAKVYDVSSNVSAPLKEFVLKMSELGHCYEVVKEYIDMPRPGLMVQGFKYGMDKELQEYYRLLALIQEKVQLTSVSVDTPLSEETSASTNELTLLKLRIWIMDPIQRFEILSSMVNSVRDKNGGEFCSMIYRYTQHGDERIQHLAVSLLTTVTKPLYLMLGQWILYGEVQDPYLEFFIKTNHDCRKEDLWHSKFELREKMIPCFISKKQAEMILAIGKNINFLRDICNNRTGYAGRNEIQEIIQKSPIECLFIDQDKRFWNAMQTAYKTTSDMVLRVLMNQSRLMDHLHALKKYLLLGQGDFIQYLLQLLKEELNKPASKLYTHNISAILESAIRATNAQFEDEDILRRLDTRILAVGDNETGWDAFCLDYHAHGPIGTVLTEDIILRYSSLFISLWKIKRVEALLSTLWKNQTTLFKFQKYMPELGPVLHQSQLLISEMQHFAHQTQYFMMFEVLECSWESLEEKIKKATDLDQVIKAHSEFLDTISKRSLIHPEKRELHSQLRAIFTYVHQLNEFLTLFDQRVTTELESRRKFMKNATKKEEREAQKHFFIEYIAQARSKIESLYLNTQDAVQKFLLTLNVQQDSDSLILQCLSFRLDFSEYYASKDSRVNIPLTFLHRRMSISTSGPGNGSSFTHSYNSMNMSSFANMSSSLPPLQSFTIPE